MSGSPPNLDRDIVVMKFGGTSVATAEGRRAIAFRVDEALNTGRAPVLVVSAMGRRGEPYATDTLLDLISSLPQNARERDLLASVGETVSAVLVAHELRQAGIAACALTGAEAGIVTDGVFGDATITAIHTAPLWHRLVEGEVPVVCGFQGATADGHLATLGRGGSDTTGCALGVALGAVEVEIYTDVDGVMTADPRTCEGATVLSAMTADELFQMARHGSRVVHTPAAELALQSGLPLRVRNTFSSHPGTQVANLAAYRPTDVATAVTSVNHLVRFSVVLGEAEDHVGNTAAASHIFRAMAESDLSLDMFTPLRGALVFSVDASAADAAAAVLATTGHSFTRSSALSKITLVGAGMHGVPGVMAQMVELLAAAEIPILQSSDSHTTISALVPEQRATDAVRVLHEGFGLSRVG